MSHDIAPAVVCCGGLDGSDLPIGRSMASICNSLSTKWPAGSSVQITFDSWGSCTQILMHRDCSSALKLPIMHSGDSMVYELNHSI